MVGPDSTSSFGSFNTNQGPNIASCIRCEVIEAFANHIDEMISLGMECAAGGQATKNRSPDFDLMKLSPSCPKGLYEISACWFNVATVVRYNYCRIYRQGEYFEESMNIGFSLVGAATLNLGNLVIGLFLKICDIRFEENRLLQDEMEP
jgi:hypothetical protein